MTFRVLVPQPVAPEGLDILRAAGLQLVEPHAMDVEALKDAIADCQALLLRTIPVPVEVLDAASGLKVISRHGAGLDNVDLDYCARRGIQVTYAPDSNTTAVVEHALMLLLALAKDVTTSDRQVRAGHFEWRNSHLGVELAGKTLGVVGLGRIGQLVAARAAAGLGMRIIGYDPYADQVGLDPAIAVVDLPTLLAEADAVTVHVPLSSATRHLLGGEELALMRPGSWLVNCSRGGVVDETALVRALESGRLRGAALDVFEAEPLPAGHPLTALPNVILTPHMAAHTDESMVRMAVHAAQGIVSVAQGAEPRWPVQLPETQPAPATN